MATATAPSSILSNEEELYWLALRMMPGLGARRSRNCWNGFAAFAPFSMLRRRNWKMRACPGRSPGRSRAGAASKMPRPAATGARRRSGLITAGRCALSGIAAACFRSASRFCFAAGRMDLLSAVCVGVVGTRHPTPYGVAAAERLAGDLARAGVTDRFRDGAWNRYGRAQGNVSRRRHRQSPFWAAGSTSFIHRKTASWPRRLRPKA